MWWGTFIVILVADNIAIGAKKLWIYRKDQLQAAQNQGAIVVNKNLHQQPQQNALQLNNARHNQDLTTWRQNILACLIFVGMILGPYMTLFLVEKNDQNLEALRFFFTFNTLFLARAFLMPVLFFVMNKHARRHVKRTFWNEWAPDFIQVYNPNRVDEIELNNDPGSHRRV